MFLRETFPSALYKHGTNAPTNTALSRSFFILWIFKRKKKYGPLAGSAKVIQLLLYCVNADPFAVFAYTLKFNSTVNKSKKGIVRSSADVVAGVDMCSALLNENVARENELTVGTLGSQTLGF